LAAFTVHKVYYVAHRDLLVLAGAPESGLPKPGWSVDLPRDVQGPGWVPIHDVQNIPFKDGEKMAIILEYEVITGAPLMEFSSLEGLTLDVRPA
jgi:hypothetical protein